MSELNETVEVEVIDASVVTVPIDTTLTQDGQAADAGAVGRALANLGGRVTVDGQEADNQGVVLLYASHIPMSADEGAKKISEVLSDLGNRTGADIVLDDSAGSQTIAQALGGISDAISSAVAALYPVGIIVATTGASAPNFGFGTWAEVKITATWDDLENGNRSWTAGTGTGSVHFWRRME